MKVLWFTNTVSLASEILNEGGLGGGWIASLEKQVGKVDNIELGVAFHHGVECIGRYENGKTKYYTFPDSSHKGKIRRLWNRWTNSMEHPNIVHHYLNVVEEFKPDIIHIFGTEQAFGLITSYLKIPVIIQIQGNLTVISKKWFNGLRFTDMLRYSNIRLLILASGLYHEYFLITKTAKRERKIFKECKYFIGRTDWDRRVTNALSSNATYFHCDELLRDQFYGATWKNPGNDKIVLFSTLKPTTYKGLEIVLETAAILNKERKLDFEWHIAGIIGNEEIIQIIENSYKQKFTDQNIRFRGALQPEKLLHGLLKANCFIHPSHIENSPNSVCEAMLLGMPVISTYAGGIPSIIKDKEEGVLVQDGDPYALAGAILELLADPNYSARVGKHARAKAIVRHNAETIVNTVLNIYSEVLSKEKIAD